MSKTDYISKREEMMRQLVAAERDLALTKMRVRFLLDQIESLNKIIEITLNLSGEKLSKDDHTPGDTTE